MRRLARVFSGGMLLVTLTAPGVPGHKRQTRDGRWRSCDCSDAVVLAGGMAGWNASLGGRWNRFIDHGVRRDPDLWWMGDGAYFKATEAQRRGALHLHVLVRVPEGLVVTPAMVERLGLMAEGYGFGHVLDVQAVEGHRAAGYVAKYVSKGADDRPHVPWQRQVEGEVDERNVPPMPGYALRNGWVRFGPYLRRKYAVTRRHASYRTWTASRSWPMTMRWLREAQQHYAEVYDVLPAWVDGAGLPAPVALVAPDRPD